MEQHIQRNIMRRVYYAYAVSIMTSSAFWQGVVLGGSVALFGRLTHVASLAENFLNVPVGQTPAYVLQSVTGAIASGELLTVLVTVLMAVLSGMFAVRVASLLRTPQPVLAS